MKTKYCPLGNNLLIDPHTPEQITAGGIVIPEMAQKKMNEGKVYKLGPLVQELEVGDVVMWDPNSEYKLSIDDEKAVCVDASNILLYFRPVKPTKLGQMLKKSEAVVGVLPRTCGGLG